MVTIDKVYYSQATEDINIIVKDNTFGIEWFEDSMSSIKLSTELDEKLIEFKKYLEQFVKETGLFANDIGGDNLLIRRTSYGPQLVVNDPIYGKD